MNRIVIDQALKHILDWEGGYVDHPADVGGPTNFGITLPTLSRWLGRDAILEELRNITPELAAKIYERFYINETPYTRIIDPWTFRYVVDMGVLHLPKTVAKIVQKAARPLLKIDGIFGDHTTTVVNELSLMEGTHHEWQKKLRQERTYHYARRVRNDPTQSAFVLGWIKRAHAL
jgi:lysozyme family protein